jgi:hypothetical protein
MLLCLLWLYHILPLELFLIDIVCFGQCRNTALPSSAISMLCLLNYLPLGLLCLLGCYASWAALPFGLLCLLGFISTLCLSGYVSSTLSALTMPVYWYASWATLPLGLYIDTLPLRLCLIDIVCFDNACIMICLLGRFCLLSYFASLGFMSTLSLSGYVSSTLSALTMLVYWYASWAVPTLGTC